MVKLHEVSPREQDGRDTLARYKAQTKAAGLASLEILENRTVDRIFCDWHDDFVVRKIIDGKAVYHFFQVKTKRKQNDQWSLLELIGVNNTYRKNDSAVVISESYLGKLLVHTVNFYDTCERVVFLTNIYVKDEVEDLLEAINRKDYSHKTLAKLFQYFDECFCDANALYSEDEIKNLISKLIIVQGAEHIKIVGDNFESLAKAKIFEYSEIDLEHIEAKEILENLLTLIDSKSTGVLPDKLSEVELDKLTGIGLDDLLSILSLSKIAFQSLVDGGDTKALKHLSILHRILKRSKTPEHMINFAAQCKTEWDIWYMKNRHNVPEYDMNILESSLSEAIERTMILGNIFTALDSTVENILQTVEKKPNLKHLSKETVLGGLFSVMVRSH